MNLPFILSGPILRRTEMSQVFIWLATSRCCKVNPVFYKVFQKDPDFQYEKIPTQGKTTTVQMGKNLFIHLIKTTPEEAHFPTDTLIGYNLDFLDEGECKDLGSLGLLSPQDPHSIVYGSLRFPTFQIKSLKGQSNILYGSCRKLHGKGEDTLASGDTLLEKHSLNLMTRPDALFLMGDQIYADDVADPAIRVISKLGQELIGQQERLDLIEPRIGKEPIQTAMTQINGRQYIMESLCQFTSTYAQNHLIEFGEFAAMYLLSWGPQVWEAEQAASLFESFNEAVHHNHVHFVYPNQKPFQKQAKSERAMLKRRYQDQQNSLRSFQRSLYRVRRLLANIPTYMILDDHDITDDWNISAIWKQNVWNSPLGRHVVANGLSAYWAFQGWGNDPNSFHPDFIQKLDSHFRHLMNGNFHSGYEDWIKQLWTYHSWHFISPTSPKAVFLDSRTQRAYNSKPVPVRFGKKFDETDSPPKLVSEEAWGRITKKLQESGWEPNTPLIVVAATPVYGMGLIESFLHDYIYPFQLLGVEVTTSFDFEAWKYNSEGFTEFLTNVANWGANPCLILSGDVHYASAVKSMVTFKDGRKLSIYQYTSSPLKNMSFYGLWGFFMKIVIGLNVRERKNKDIFRICTPGYEIARVNKEEHSKGPFLWKDELRYQIFKDNSIIETNNNLGFITISPDYIDNTLLLTDKAVKEK